MGYKHFTIAIIIRLLLIIILTIIACFCFFKDHIYPTGITTAIILITTINTLLYFNKINRWISFFLLGIENEDTTLKIPKKTGNKVLDDVFKGMNRLNELFKQTKIEINTQEQYYRTVLNQSATGLFSIDEKGRVIDINPAATKLTQLIQFQHINTLIKIEPSLPQFLSNDKMNKSSNSAIYENKQGQKLLFKLSEIETIKQKIRLVAVSDITKELDNSEVDAWIKLARTLSHEIMNNITPITTLSHVIHNYFVIDKKPIELHKLEQKTIDYTVKGIQVIEERSAGLLNFVENYRKFTKLPEPNFKSVKLDELIENVLLACSAFTNYNNTTIEQNYTHTLTAVADVDLLSQVLINLIKNALEANSTGNNSTDQSISINTSSDNNSNYIEISNPGFITPELRELIFVPFFTTKEEGTGVGLSLSKQIMLKMGGDLILKTDSPNQVKFIITL